MAIYDHQYGDLSYFRVFRAWGGQEYQEYVRIKRSRDAAYKKALEIDKRLAKAQQTFITQQALSASFHVRSNGQIRGLRRVNVKRKGRKPIEVFELRINVPWREDIKRTTLSIAVHGEQKAFALALDVIIDGYGIKPKSNLAKALHSCFSAYSIQTETTKQPAEKTKALKTFTFKESATTLAASATTSTTTAAEHPGTQMDDFSEVSPVRNLVFKKAKDELTNITDGFFKGLKRFTA